MKMQFNIWWDWPSYGTKANVSLIESSVDMSEVWPERICTGTVEIEVGEPPAQADFTPAKITAYRKEIGRHVAAVTEIEGKIQSLLCIEHRPEEAVTAEGADYVDAF